MNKYVMNKLRKVEVFSANYRTLLSSETLTFKAAGSWDRIKQDWWFALLFFFGRHDVNKVIAEG